MTRILAVGTYGSDDPTRAAMPLITAQGALEGGNEAEVALLGEATYLLRPGIADEVVAVAFGNVGERMRALIDQGVPVYV
jgi:predicted peroxiredoxin